MSRMTSQEEPRERGRAAVKTAIEKRRQQQKWIALLADIRALAREDGFAITDLVKELPPE